jgi:hypothetical protein
LPHVAQAWEARLERESRGKQEKREERKEKRDKSIECREKCIRS